MSLFQFSVRSEKDKVYATGAGSFDREKPPWKCDMQKMRRRRRIRSCWGGAELKLASWASKKKKNFFYEIILWSGYKSHPLSTLFFAMKVTARGSKAASDYGWCCVFFKLAYIYSSSTGTELLHCTYCCYTLWQR